jgi:uncharacterized protein YpmS
MNTSVALQIAKFLRSLNGPETEVFNLLAQSGDLPEKFSAFPAETTAVASLFAKISAMPALG